ncbi:MAG TPA: LysM peptidoglycan-binding domain-containing protein [Candidatus Saccharimonadales bacterium]|nr:LysM peptidoglycan-binding domain-containing protein [Candidatus Saccharimonadales bacterium]
MQVLRPSVFGSRLRRMGSRLSTNRLAVRYALVMLNVVLLATIAVFAVRGSQTGQLLSGQTAVIGGSNGATEPLDQLSSADIAVNTAIAVGLAETPGVKELADSAATKQAVAPADATVVAKPQTVNTALKSRKDIKDYIVQSGESVTSIAAKFSVTSDSIMWSNNLRSNTINAGVKLLIPPINGIVYGVQSGDTVESLAQKFRAGREQIIAFNDIELTGLKPGERILIPNGQQPAPVVASAFVGRASFGGYNGYDAGFCTYYAAKRRAELGNPAPSNLGNANTWASRAAEFGIPTGPTPRPGAVAMKHARAPGHVAIVEVVTADGFWISEMNSYGQVSMTDTRPTGGWGRVNWKFIPNSLAGTYTYIY